MVNSAWRRFSNTKLRHQSVLIYRCQTEFMIRSICKAFWHSVEKHHKLTKWQILVGIDISISISDKWKKYYNFKYITIKMNLLSVQLVENISFPCSRLTNLRLNNVSLVYASCLILSLTLWVSSLNNYSLFCFLLYTDFNFRFRRPWHVNKLRHIIIYVLITKLINQVRDLYRKVYLLEVFVINNTFQ